MLQCSVDQTRVFIARKSKESFRTEIVKKGKKAPAPNQNKFSYKKGRVPHNSEFEVNMTGILRKCLQNK